MLFCRFQACSLAIIALLITRIVAIGLETVGSKVESSPRSLISDIGAGIDGIIGDIKGDFGKLEQDVESEIAKALVNSDGVLGQFTMAYQTYATRSIAPDVKASLTMDAESHPSALNC
jgi:hypothetical protein